MKAADNETESIQNKITLYQLLSKNKIVCIRIHCPEDYSYEIDCDLSFDYPLIIQKTVGLKDTKYKINDLEWIAFESEDCNSIIYYLTEHFHTKYEEYIKSGRL